jgi:hypothetical protein
MAACSLVENLEDAEFERGVCGAPSTVAYGVSAEMSRIVLAYYILWYTAASLPILAHGLAGEAQRQSNAAGGKRKGHKNEMLLGMHCKFELQ